MAYPVWDVVRFIVRSGDIYDDGDSITNMKLQKLLYYSQGYHLAAFNRALFDEKIVAEEHGPVVPDVWERFAILGRDPIRYYSRKPLDFDKLTLQLITNVYRVYGQFSAWRLRQQTHTEIPWREARKMGNRTGNYEITHDSMKMYFATKLGTKDGS